MHAGFLALLGPNTEEQQKCLDLLYYESPKKRCSTMSIYSLLVSIMGSPASAIHISLSRL